MITMAKSLYSSNIMSAELMEAVTMSLLEYIYAFRGNGGLLAKILGCTIGPPSSRQMDVMLSRLLLQSQADTRDTVPEVRCNTSDVFSN